MTTREQEAAAFPSHEAYAWHQTCGHCKAAPGELCAVPRKWATHSRMNEVHAAAGLSEVEAPEYGFMHARRLDAGIRHRGRDIARAPWAEDREPRRVYDTLPRPLLPAPSSSPETKAGGRSE